MPTTSMSGWSRYEMSGSTRSTPGMSSCGNMRPASTTSTLRPHSSAHMLMPTSPRPPSGTYRSWWFSGPREPTPKALSSWGSSPKAQLLGLRLRCSHWNRRRRRREELVEVALQRIEVVLEVGHQRTVVERRGRVIERHVGDVTPADETAVDARDRSLAGHQALQRVPSQDQHDLRIDQVELLLEIGRARLNLVRHRVAVHRRPALQHVGDVDVAATHADAGQQGVEQLARGANERLALPVLVEARSFADDHHIRWARPHTRHRLCARGMKAAVLARANRFVDP